MSAFAKIAVGVALVAATIFTAGALAPALAEFLLAAGASLVLGGIGTLLTKTPGSPNGAQRNPIAPWSVVYGRAKVGGTVIYIEENGDTNKYLHQVIVLACHPCQSVDAVYFDNKRVVLDQNGNSISFGDSTAVIGSQRTSNIQSISRANDVVTVVLQSPIAPPDPASQYPYVALMDGDMLIVQNVGTDKTLNGTWAVSVVNATTFTYLCGGNPITLAFQGSVKTTYPDYGDTVHMEVLLGNHTSTFPGLLSGSNGLWTDQHLLLGRTAVYLRLKYGGQTYANGLPNISFLVRGKNDVFDPRNNSNSYTENAALCIADYLAHPTWGFKAVYGTEIPSLPLTAAANVCDESVPLASGATEPRYACNGSFPLSTKRGEVLQNLLTSCGGRLTYSGGQFTIHTAAWGGVSLALGDRAIQSATMRCLTSHTSGGAGAGQITLSNNPDIGDGPVFDLSAWTLRTDSIGLASPTVSSLLSTQAWCRNWDTANSDISGYWHNIPGPCQFLIYEVWIDVVYVDGSTGVWRPTQAVVNDPAPGGGGSPLGGAGGTVTNPNAAIDGNPSTYALIDRNAFRSLADDNVCTLVLSNFVEVSTSAATAGPGILQSTLGPGPFQWKAKLPLRDLYNGVKGTFISPVSNWQTSDFPAYAQDQTHGYSNGPAQYYYDANLAADGGDRRWLDIQLPFTISVATAQRLAKIELLRRRQQGTGTFAFHMAIYQCTALDCVYFTLPTLGWQRKLLEITAHRFTQTKQQAGNGQEVTLLGTEIDVQETDPSIYNWSPTEELSVEGFQQAALPTMESPQPPTGIGALSDATTSAVSSSGVATSRILLSWYPPDDGYVTNGGSIEIRYAPVGQTTWTALPQVDGSATQAYIDGVSDGTTYTIQMRSVNAAGIASPWLSTIATAAGAASQINASALADALPAFTVNGT